jgi:WD40 repeat protein
LNLPKKKGKGHEDASRPNAREWCLLLTAVAWSPDGRRIASGYWDGWVDFWDAADGGNSDNFGWHSGYSVNAVAWSPDGTRIASGSNDFTAQVLQAE